ncbi:hypothetical protein TNCV_2027691, partial [Trichonephila clavipes]
MDSSVNKMSFQYIVHVLRSSHHSRHKRLCFPHRGKRSNGCLADIPLSCKRRRMAAILPRSNSDLGQKTLGVFHETQAVTPKCVGGPPVDRNRLNAPPGSIVTHNGRLRYNSNALCISMAPTHDLNFTCAMGHDWETEKGPMGHRLSIADLALCHDEFRGPGSDAVQI